MTRLVKKRTGIPINIRLTMQIIMISSIVILSIVMLFLITYQTRLLVSLQNKKELQILMAHEVREASNDLTKMSRSFIGTKGDKKYKTYYEAIIKWRRGFAPRPDTVSNKLYPGRVISQRALLQELGCTPEELDFLYEVAEVSTSLSYVEQQAMNCIEENRYVIGPRLIASNESVSDFATRIMYDERYHAELQKIFSLINSFTIAVDTRISTAVEQAEALLTVFSIMEFVFSIALGILLSFFYRLTKKQVGAAKDKA